MTSSVTLFLYTFIRVDILPTIQPSALIPPPPKTAVIQGELHRQWHFLVIKFLTFVFSLKVPVIFSSVGHELVTFRNV